jgi:hypothetical protein
LVAYGCCALWQVTIEVLKDSTGLVWFGSSGLSGLDCNSVSMRGEFKLWNMKGYFGLKFTDVSSGLLSVDVSRLFWKRPLRGPTGERVEIGVLSFDLPLGKR